MFTLRFEKDNVSTDDETSVGGPFAAITMMTETPSFRTRAYADRKGLDVLIPNEHGVEIGHMVAHGDAGWDRCFVMNEAGKTVARYTV